MQRLFDIVYEDGEHFVGGSSYLSAGDWGKSPQKKIRTFFVRLPFGDNLVLSGYDRYYYRIEACKDFYGVNTSKLRIEYIFVYAQKQNKIKKYKIDLKKAMIEGFIKDINDNEIRGLNPKYWR